MDGFMIDHYMTKMQTIIAFKSASFFRHKKSEGSLFAFGAYGVMPVMVGLTGALDYIKLPLSLIEEIAKGVFLIIPSFFSPRLFRRVVRHLKDAKNYGILCVYKLLQGAPADLSNIYQSFKNPFKDTHAMFSYYGVNSVSERDNNYYYGNSEWESLHPSIGKNA